MNVNEASITKNKNRTWRYVSGDRFPIGGMIFLYVSIGGDPTIPERIEIVPNLVGMLVDEAMAYLDEMAERARSSIFPIEVIHRRYSDEPENTIILQSLEPGSALMTYNTIGIVISLGTQMALVPNIQFRPVSEAEQMLLAAGFSITTQREHSESVAANHIISQSHAGGITIPFGTNITIVISEGGAS